MHGDPVGRARRLAIALARARSAAEETRIEGERSFPDQADVPGVSMQRVDEEISLTGNSGREYTEHSRLATVEPCVPQLLERPGSRVTAPGLGEVGEWKLGDGHARGDVDLDRDEVPRHKVRIDVDEEFQAREGQ